MQVRENAAAEALLINELYALFHFSRSYLVYLPNLLTSPSPTHSPLAPHRDKVVNFVKSCGNASPGV